MGHRLYSKCCFWRLDIIFIKSIHCFELSDKLVSDLFAVSL